MCDFTSPVVIYIEDPNMELAEYFLIYMYEINKYLIRSPSASYEWKAVILWL